MIRSYSNYPLKKLHTFGTEAYTKYYFEFTEMEDLAGFLATNQDWPNWQILILGGGSNLLFVNDFPGLIIHPNIPGIRIVHEDRNNIWLEVGAGVIWDDLVEYSVINHWGGIENLSLIPGRVGAAAVQNIGAYGIEIRNRIESVSGLDLDSQSEITYENADCQYAYRDSIFKNQLKNRFVITSVILKLDKFPEFILNYGDLKAKMGKLGSINLRNIREAVIAIRESKLPDPKVFGNAGSFFKNPVVESVLADQILKAFPDMPNYPVYGGKNKLAAGWLIEQCGWKGFREGDAGVHEKQALVIVNYGEASGNDILQLALAIQNSVKMKFGIEMEMEVNII